jgi:hypothetical protein
MVMRARAHESNTNTLIKETKDERGAGSAGGVGVTNTRTVPLHCHALSLTRFFYENDACLRHISLTAESKF